MQQRHKQTKNSVGSVSVDCICVDPKEVHLVWPYVSQFIQKAMERSDLGLFSELLEDVFNANALLWLAYSRQNIEAAAVTQIIKTEKSKVCMLQACGGFGAKKWIGLLEVIENYAKSEKCDCVRMMGRKGWAKMLTDYKCEKIVLERQL